MLGEVGEGQEGEYHVLGEAREGQEREGMAYEVPIQSKSKTEGVQGGL